MKPTVSGIINKQNTQPRTTVSGVISQQNNRLKTTVAGVISQQDGRLKGTVTGAISKHDSRLKPTTAEVINHQDVKLKSGMTALVGQKNEHFKSAVLRGTSLGQQSVSPSTRAMKQQDRHNVSSLSVEVQNKVTGTGNNNQDKTPRSQVTHSTEHTLRNKHKSLSYQSQRDRRPSVYPNSQQQHIKTAGSVSPVEFVSTSRSSPVLLYPSNAEKLSTRYPILETQNIRHSVRPGDFSTSGSSEPGTTPDSTRSNERKYITEDHSELYLHQTKTGSRTSEYETNKSKYLPRFDNASDCSIPHDYQVDESIDMRKHARGADDEILLTNVIPSKRAHSPHDVIYTVPVFQPSHYPHGGFELCDLPNTAFPVRASSRIFMPPHQVFAGPGHPAFSPYAPHIIATIGTDPGTLYQLPMQDYYAQELAYPMDAPVQILHS